jgi:hypothetical protein
MKRMLPWICLAVSVGAASIAFGSELHDGWDRLLGKHVRGGLVDYQGFKADEAELDTYLELLDRTDPHTLSSDGRLALYLNAYNAYTVKLILDHFKEGVPPPSIRDIGGLFKGPWDMEIVHIGGRTYTLDNIEHDIIRVEFDEPRIHMAVNCASISCPPLLAQAYREEYLESQLEEATRAFLDDPDRNYLAGDTLYVSRIFKWYGEDFADDPVQFFRKHAGEDLRRGLEAGKEQITVKYLSYDWSLNEISTQ